jgi:hypothetical protein
VVPCLGMCECQAGGRHGGDDEEEAPEIGRVNAAARNQVIDGAGKQEGKNRGGDGEASDTDKWK